MLFDRKTT